MITVLHKNDGRGPYRKTLQYGFDLQQAIDRRMGMKLNGLNPHPFTPQQSAEIETDMYACGFLPPHYPTPTKLGEVLRDRDGRLVIIEDVDETFDPAFTWDCTNGIWPSDSPNNR